MSETNDLNVKTDTVDPALHTLQAVVDRKELLEALKLATLALGRNRNVMPATSNVKLWVDGESLWLSGAGFEAYAETRLGVHGTGKPGEVCVNINLLQTAAQGGNGVTVKILAKMLKGEARLLVDSGSARYNLACMGMAHLLESTKPAATGLGTLPAADFTRALTACVTAATNDQSRYILAGVNLEFGDQLMAVSTDGRRMHNVGLPLNDSAPEDVKQSLNIPDSMVPLLTRLAEAGDVTLALSDSHLWLRADRQSVAVRLIEGKYPDWRQVIPPATGLEWQFDQAAMLDAWKRLKGIDAPDALLRVADSSCQLRGFNLGTGAIYEEEVPATVVSETRTKKPQTKGPDGKMQDVPCAWSEVRLNVAQVIDVLTACGPGDVMMYMRWSSEPVRLHNESGDFTGVLCGIRPNPNGEA